MNNEKPCLVPARQGFSILYKGRYLYSKYDPIQNCERLVSSLNILPGSLIFVFSPLLCYGLNSLLKKIDTSSFVIALETDPELYEVSLPYIQNFNDITQFKYFLVNQDTKGISEILQYCNTLIKIEKRFFLKRLVTVSFAKTDISNEFKTTLIKYTDSFIDFFWKNRITISKMGRLYARNIFKNLPSVISSVTLKKASITKPIVVLGAGVSLERFLPYLKNNKDKFFIICVDSAVIPLLEFGITPQIIEAVECQLANVKAFIGSANTFIHLNTDLSSRPRVQKILNGNVSFFLSEYETSPFLLRIAQLLSLRVTPPLGSVGLSAIHTALFLRAPDTPVFFSGLDFCYQPGKTHCKGSPHHYNVLNSANRLSPPGSTSGYFAQSVKKVTINEVQLITDPALQKYALLFNEEFSSFKNLYNLSNISLVTMLPYVKTGYLDSCNNNTNSDDSFFYSVDISLKNNIQLFLEKEKSNLLTIKDGLIHGSLDVETLLNLLQQHDYLFLHFPDGYKKPNLSEGFLKRVRAEIDFFLKDIDSALCQL